MLPAAAMLTAVIVAISGGTARAQDLLLLNGDTQTVSGNVQYGLVYIDGDLELAGDTTISASSIYIGPDAWIDSCYVAGAGYNGCTAGRSLTLQSSGPLTVARPIDLTGGTGTVQPGGSLSLSGGPVTVAGDITTAGTGGGASGTVQINSTGSLAVGGIYAPGASVNLHASGAIDVAGAIQTQGTGSVLASDPTRVQSAGPVTVDSSGGDVRIDGTIAGYGRDAPAAGALAGGNGAAVAITGSDVRTQDIYATGGGAAAGAPGASSKIEITARGSLQALGRIDASGQSGSAGTGAGGGQVALNANGPLSIGGDVDVSGGPSAAGGSITVSGSPVAGDQLLAMGGQGSASVPGGGAGGAIDVTAPAGATLGNLLAYGGGSPGGAAAGSGGTISATSSSGSIATGQVDTGGGYQNSGPGAAGGPITLSAGVDLDVGPVSSNGSGAGGSASPPWSGGNAGPLTLRAGTGTLTLGGNATAQGGTGSGSNAGGALGGSGGSGGQAEVVAHAIGALASLSTAGGSGGDYGTTQGPGGAGGAIVAFTNAPIFNDQELVSSDGGDGNPTGTAGNQQQNSSPTAPQISPSTGLLSFTPESPAAQSYRVLMSVGKNPPTTALTTTATTGLKPKAPLCMSVSFTVVAVDSAAGWTSDPSPAVSYTRPPSATQGCSTAPKVTVAAAALRRSLRKLRRARWVAALKITASGIGTVAVTLSRGRGRHGQKVASVELQLTRPGAHVLPIRLPPAARRPGSYRLTLATTSPNGKGHLSTALTLAVLR
jgi:hypothetical protein